MPGECYLFVAESGRAPRALNGFRHGTGDASCPSMASEPGGTGAGGAGTPELPTVNRWLCLTRLRAAGAVAVFTLVLHYLDVTEMALLPVLGVCFGLALVSWAGLRVQGLMRKPRTLFWLQSLADLLGITLAIHFAVTGTPALIFRGIYALVIVPASLVSVPSGLAMAAMASGGHAWLLGAEQGFDHGFASLEYLTPPFLFFLLAQQCFFYGAQLKQKNSTLAALATQLEESGWRLAAEARMSAALLDVARTLSTTLEGPELLGRLNTTTCRQLDADWSATFVVDPERATFRLVSVTDVEAQASEIGRLELPTRSWPPVERLANERVVVLTGAEAGHTPGMSASGRDLSIVLLVGLYRELVLVGFLAVGFTSLAPGEQEQAAEFLSGIAQHATIVLRNARLLEEVRLASAMKSEFVGAISHELRSPLNVMLGYLEMTLDGAFGAVPADAADALRRVQQQALVLLEMITALLDLNRLEAGRLPVQRAPVSISVLLDEIRTQLPESWRRPVVELKLAVAPDLPTIETDAGKLRTVVRNLLHNALKFTDHGRVTLGAALTANGDLAISVTDTGRGIPPDAIRYIFELFRQVPGAGGGGVGLGLHLVRRLVQALGGTVSVTSEVGKGSCFTVTLPRTADPVEDAPRNPLPRGTQAHAA